MSEGEERQEASTGMHSGGDRTHAHRNPVSMAKGLDRQIDRLEVRRAAKAEDRAQGILRGQRMRAGTEKLLTRTTSGAIYAILVVACIFVHPFATVLLVSAMAWLCCSELYRICRMAGRMPMELVGLTAAVAFPVASYIWGLPGIVLLVLLLLIATACWYVFTPRASLADVSATVFGPIYTSVAFCSVVFLRMTDPGIDGALLAFGSMASVWVNDAFAYFVGSRFGAHKMAPRISPHKSWEGFAGGMCGSILVFVLLSRLWAGGDSLPVLYAIFMGLVVGTVGDIGDLFESRIKRGVGVKDSGNIMPGHGGLLDRSDSLLFGCTTAYILLLFGGII